MELDGAAPQRAGGRAVAVPSALFLATLVIVLVLATPGAPTIAAPAPCGDSAEAVVRTFFARLGEAPERIAECWRDLHGDALAAYAGTRAPDELRLGDVHLGQRGSTLLAAYPVFASWRLDLPPRGFSVDGAMRWVVLERDGGRWRIVEVQVPR